MGTDFKMDLYVKDFLISTLDMTGPEAAAYLLTLAVAWPRGAELPIDPDAIRRMIRYDAEDWARVWPAIERKWSVVGDHRENGRQRRVMQETENRIALRSQAGRKGNAVRWHGDPDGIANTSPSPSPSPSKKTLSHPPLAADPNSFDLFWTAYPRKVKKPKALLAWNRLSPSDHAAILETLPSWPFDTRDNLRFVPYPEAWLHGRRWEDDAPPPPANPALVGSHGPATPEELFAAASVPSDADIERWTHEAEADLSRSGFSHPGEPRR